MLPWFRQPHVFAVKAYLKNYLWPRQFCKLNNTRLMREGHLIQNIVARPLKSAISKRCRNDFSPQVLGIYLRKSTNLIPLFNIKYSKIYTEQKYEKTVHSPRESQKHKNWLNKLFQLNSIFFTVMWLTFISDAM